MKKRLYVLFVVFITLSMVLAACGGATQEPAGEDAGGEEMTGEDTGGEEMTGEDSGGEEMMAGHEAPMLAEMVANGELPPLEERLPTDVQVVEVVDTIGEYGGTWYNVASDSGMATIKMAFYDPPVRWKPDYTGYEEGLAKSFEFNDDGTQLTYHLREGVKWSDGAPYTTADWDFWWNDMANNEDYKVVSVPWWARNTDGTPFTIEFPDEYTVVMTWDSARWIAPYILAQGFWEWEPLMKPAHFLKQFHPNYDGESYEELELQDKWWETPGYPTIFAWYCQDVTPGEKVTFVRNPYYWKTDTDGNQLPYIDYVTIDIQPDVEVRVLNLSQGKYTASFRGTDDPNNIPFLQEQSEANGYHLQPGWMNGAGGWPAFLINQYYDGEECKGEQEECRDLLRDKNFRKGLSVAIDRQRVIDVVWDGLAEPTQATISPQSWHFASDEGQAIYQEWKNADIEYDPAEAEAYFDAAGFVDCDGDGWRDLPETCNPFTLIIDMNDWGGENVNVETNELVKEMWNAVGVDVLVNNLIGQPDADTRGNYGLFMIRNTHISEIDLWTYPDWVFPMRGGGEGSRAFPLEGLYYSSGGEEGVQPADGSPAQRLQELYDMGLSEPDEQKRHEIVYEAMRINIEEGPFVLGISGDQPMPVVVADNFHNVPEYGVLGPWAPASPGNTHPEQYWISQ